MLREVRWDWPYLWGVDLHGVDLTKAELSLADLSIANLTGANLASSHFWRSDLKVADLRNAVLQCARFDLIDASYSPGPSDEPDEYTHFDNANMRGINIDGGNFERAVFDGADLSPGPCGGKESLISKFDRSNVRDANFRGASFRKAKLHDINLIKTDMRGSNLEYADMSGANLSGSNLEETNLSGVNLNGAVYSPSTRWPAGFDAEARGAHMQARAVGDF
jgi:uncharacterized protein YjbI with pentapeptide repeats